MGEQTNSTIGTVGGVAAGWASYKYLPKIFGRPYSRWFITECRDISKSEHNKYWSVTQKALESSGLKKQGIELVDINNTNLEGVTKDTFEKMDRVFEEKTNKIIDKMFEKLKAPRIDGKKIKFPSYKQEARPKWKYILFGPSGDEKLKGTLKGIAKGDNACYVPFIKNVYVNKDKMGFSTCHEVGHAINANSTKWLKALSLGRHVTTKLAPVLLAVALIKKRKPESPDGPEAEQTKKNFLKDNIGLLTFGCLLPTVAEEGLASINGAKLVKKYLTPQELKKLNVTNAKAWSTYLIGAALLSAFAQFAVIVKDKLVEPKVT